jgi:hypothetical protein
MAAGQVDKRRDIQQPIDGRELAKKSLAVGHGQSLIALRWLLDEKIGNLS